MKEDVEEKTAFKSIGLKPPLLRVGWINKDLALSIQRQATQGKHTQFYRVQPIEGELRNEHTPAIQHLSPHSN